MGSGSFGADGTLTFEVGSAVVSVGRAGVEVVVSLWWVMVCGFGWGSLRRALSFALGCLVRLWCDLAHR